MEFGAGIWEREKQADQVVPWCWCLQTFATGDDVDHEEVVEVSRCKMRDL